MLYGCKQERKGTVLYGCNKKEKVRYCTNYILVKNVFNGRWLQQGAKVTTVGGEVILALVQHPCKGGFNVIKKEDGGVPLFQDGSICYQILYGTRYQTHHYFQRMVLYTPLGPPPPTIGETWIPQSR